MYLLAITVDRRQRHLPEKIRRETYETQKSTRASADALHDLQRHESRSFCAAGRG
jgi:hypothetical protein